MWVYYKTFSEKIFLMAIFLFVILVMIDIIKDLLTKNADKVFNYNTIPIVLGSKATRVILSFLSVVLIGISMLIIHEDGIHNMMNLYFSLGLFIIIFALYLLLNPIKKANFFAINILRVWVFVGIFAMFFDGIVKRF